MLRLKAFIFLLKHFAASLKLIVSLIFFSTLGELYRLQKPSSLHLVGGLFMALWEDGFMSCYSVYSSLVRIFNRITELERILEVL